MGWGDDDVHVGLFSDRLWPSGSRVRSTILGTSVSTARTPSLMSRAQNASTPAGHHVAERTSSKHLQDDVVAKPSIDLNIPEHNLSETFCFPEPKTRNGSFVFSTQQVINMDADHTVHDRSRALQVEDAKGVVAVLRQAAAHVEALVKLVPREEQLVRPGSLGPRWCTIVEERERRQRLAS